MNSTMPQGSFKIVQTIENGALLLSVVPSLWEAEGILMWPPDKTNNKIFQKVALPPGTLADGWKLFPCVVKRANIQTYAEAQKEQQQMSSNSDTSSYNEKQITMAARRPDGRKTHTAIKNADDDRTNYNHEVNTFIIFIIMHSQTRTIIAYE